MTTTHTTLGTTAPLDVSPLGLGCMGMSEFYGTRDESEATRTIHRALDLGVTFLDTHRARFQLPLEARRRRKHATHPWFAQL